MKLKKLTEYYSNHPQSDKICNALESQSLQKLQLKGLSGSASSLLLNSIAKKSKTTLFIILPDKEEAGFFFNDMENLCSKNSVYFFPSSYKRDLLSLSSVQKVEENIIARTKTIEKLNDDNPITIVTYPEALVEKEASSKTHEEQSFLISIGDKLDIDFIKEFLFEYGFTQKDFVFSPGEFSVRGSIIDVFSYSSESPYRIDFFGEEVDSIRTFDIIKQLSIQKLQKIHIHPDVNKLSDNKEKQAIFDHLKGNSSVWIKDLKYTIDKIDQISINIKKMDNSDDDPDAVVLSSDDFITGQVFQNEIQKFQIIEFGQQAFFKPDQIIPFNISKQAEFNKNFNLLAEDMNKWETNGYQNFILSDQEKQIERIQSILGSEESSFNPGYIAVIPTLHQGFIDHDLQISCYTDHQIFQRYHRMKLKSQKMVETRGAISISEISQLKPGDYVVHIDHGIGKFSGLQSIDVNGKKQETIRITYKDNDTLFVSIHSLHKVSKYKGSDGTPPRIYKLGSGAWQKIKQKTKSKVKDIAKELISLYAKRKEEKGFEFSPDSYLQEALEASFIYEDTPDQYKASQATKVDMESSIPMDRLVCGDVGFGKTEIAIRAAFKAVTDGKQVAILVPTTILALQHYHTFKKRLKEFPCSVEYISRLKSTKEQKRIYAELSVGKVDILIGTHKIVGKDIQFKDLGLLIVDEEQKFGVAIKEKLKQLKLNVDTLTLTATPIPRTLQFSLMGARDLSIINTPPPNRYPIMTELHSFNEEIIKEALQNEIQRNGQVFFIHNRVQNITEIQVLLKRLCPDIRTVVGHGQMKGNELEKVMLDFINHEYDVLIATTIIESGLDIPNTNTIIINNAQNFGLSDLHQLRGRVGRSNKKAFCYLLAPPLTVLTPEARKRLRAIEEYSDLGSGFNISLQDLDIRGAGNLLGGEQSGFIADIGFETYQQILNEALFELREEEGIQHQPTVTQELKKESASSFVFDCQIDTDLEILFPNYYIANTSERIRLYRELDNIKNEEALEKFRNNLIDRFGEIPAESTELLNVVQLRRLAMHLGMVKLIIKNGRMICYFVSDSSAIFFNSSVFARILSFVQKNQKICSLKEKQGKPSLHIEKINSIKKAFETLKRMSDA
ncbi:MAG: transcription-repair coupling factor [Bacteroidetes bacterium]|nr:MAG: transcription-repair coupling factor [Bacteroidota bacterium]